MKKLLALALLLSVMGYMTSCDDDNNDIKPAPTISVDPSTVANIPGQTVTATVTINAPNGGQTLRTYINGATSGTYPDISLSGTTGIEEFEFQIPEESVIGSTIVVTFQAVDLKNYPSEIANLTVQVNDPVLPLTGNLTTQTLVAANRYILKGQVFIKDGVTLTIPAGTVILGDKASKATLVVERGGKLVCNGTAEAPVVFTSSQGVNERDKGDWGGIVILGKAYTNQANPAVEGISPAVNFGAADRANDADNSGVLKYVRIEYGGIELTPNNETNSLTMGGVGSGTEMDYVQVSYGGDDGFEFFGGTLNAKHLISLSTWDDDFDMDYGWSGNIQFGLVVRNPFYADQSQSNAFECDNGPNDTDTPGNYTTGTFSNITVYGQRDRADRTPAASLNYGQAMDLRRRTAVSIFNSVITGFPIGLRFNQNSVKAQYDATTGKLSNNILAAGGSAYAAGSGVAFTATDVQTYWTTNGNTTQTIPPNAAEEVAFYTALGLNIDNFFARYSITTYPSNPNFSVAGGTIQAGALFSDGKFSEASRTTFFAKDVVYRGAFGATDWTDGWGEFRPIASAY